MSYLTNKTTKKRIDNTCITNSKTKREQINRHCRVSFLNVIKDIDIDFYKQITLGS